MFSGQLSIGMVFRKTSAWSHPASGQEGAGLGLFQEMNVTHSDHLQKYRGDIGVIPGVMVHTQNSNIWEAEAGGLP